MKPPGPERDKKIAELRGSKLADPMNKCIARSLDRCPQEAREEQCPDDCRFLKSNYDPYSTSIVHALDLLDEMRNAGCTFKIWMDGTGFSIERNGKPGERVKELADAISRCYLSWKETTP